MIPGVLDRGLGTAGLSQMTVLLWVRCARIPSSKLVLELFECKESPWQLGFKESAYNAGDSGLIPGSGRSPWRRKWQPTPVFLPGESHGQRSLVGYSLWGRKETHTTEQLHFRGKQTGQIGHLLLFNYIYSLKSWRRKWQPTLVFLSGKSWTEELGGLQFMRSQSQTQLSD